VFLNIYIYIYIYILAVSRWLRSETIRKRPFGVAAMAQYTRTPLDGPRHDDPLETRFGGPRHEEPLETWLGGPRQHEPLRNFTRMPETVMCALYITRYCVAYHFLCLFASFRCTVLRWFLYSRLHAFSADSGSWPCAKDPMCKGIPLAPNHSSAQSVLSVLLPHIQKAAKMPHDFSNGDASTRGAKRMLH
jgi:hypothetical protein